MSGEHYEFGLTSKCFVMFERVETLTGQWATSINNQNGKMDRPEDSCFIYTMHTMHKLANKKMSTTTSQCCFLKVLIKIVC